MLGITILIIILSVFLICFLLNWLNNRRIKKRYKEILNICNAYWESDNPNKSNIYPHISNDTVACIMEQLLNPFCVPVIDTGSMANVNAVQIGYLLVNIKENPVLWYKMFAIKSGI